MKLEIYKDGGFYIRVGKLRIIASTRHDKPPSHYPFGYFWVLWEAGDYTYALIDIGKKKLASPVE
ncbi:hypothetical protein [uncultured Nostoc sp.]|uniref:hypothetical protein n=1 Tax=uncultured Nostoc sp. TaxID=340711 RepID=UPI00262FC9BB|nr:hypothetical protein [uncultured Nostoc sp.]